MSDNIRLALRHLASAILHFETALSEGSCGSDGDRQETSQSVDIAHGSKLCLRQAYRSEIRRPMPHAELDRLSEEDLLLGLFGPSIVGALFSSDRVLSAPHSSSYATRIAETSGLYWQAVGDGAWKLAPVEATNLTANSPAPSSPLKRGGRS